MAPSDMDEKLRRMTGGEVESPVLRMTGPAIVIMLISALTWTGTAATNQPKRAGTK